MMNVTYFRPRKPGPEVEIEDAVVGQVANLFPNKGHLAWIAGSLPLGSGMPDLVIVKCNPKVTSLANFDLPDSHILSYLHSVRRASSETITKRVGGHKKKTLRCLDELVNANAVLVNSNTYSLSPHWRDILPEVITIEAKVQNWKRAVEQALRNRIFAHKSYVAFPFLVAERVRNEAIFQNYGIGLLSVRNDDVKVIRRAHSRQPRVWSYYYQIALHVANNISESI